MSRVTTKKNTVGMPISEPMGPLAPLVYDNHRNKVVVCGRRLGKTGQALRWLVHRAVTCRNAQWENWYVAPTLKAARRIAWLRLKNLIPREILAMKPNETRLEFTFVNGNRITLLGADDPDGLVGNAINTLVLDEYGKMKINAYEYLKPALKDPRGHMLMIGTPRGRNHFYDKYYYALTANNPNWITYPIYHSVDSPWVEPADIEEDRLTMDPLLFAQEYEGSFENYRGKVYKDFISDFAPKGNFDTIKFNPELETFCGLDFGWNHPFVAVWMQYDKAKNTWYILRDAFVRSEVSVSSMVRVLKGETVEFPGLTYKSPVPIDYIPRVQYIAGHEANISRQEASGANMKGILRGHGIFLKVKFHYLYISLAAVRSYILSASGHRKLIVDPRGNKVLTDAFESYHYPEKDGFLIGEEPVKDGSDDPMDAIRYALATRTPLKKMLEVT